MSGKTSWKVAFTQRAEEDIQNIIAFIGAREGKGMAENLMGRFTHAKDSLHQLPERGRIVPELKQVNILTFREIQATPYRIVYQVNNSTREVFIHLVVDGRRNFAELMRERLLGSATYEQ